MDDKNHLLFGVNLMRKVLSIFLSVLLIVLLIPMSDFKICATEATSGTTGECTWTLYDTTLTITGNGAMANYNSTSNLSPWGTNITEVVIENGVTSIGTYAFYKCTALKSISIPSSLKSIGSNAFEYCKSLPGILIPEGVASIGSNAFYNCSKINEVILPDSLVSIGDDAFALCNFTGITIPQNVSSIGEGTFGYCSVLTSIEVDEKNSTYYSANNCIIEKLTNTLVVGCNSSVIPNGVTSIGEHAFSGCFAHGNFTIPDSVTRIDGWAFAGSDFTSIELPKSVENIAYGAFFLCRNLTDVYYSGNRTDKGTINIGGSNEELTAAYWHYAPCENDAHVYDYDCTKVCRNCDYVRVADTEHTFDDDCDEVCNVCGTHRIAKHVFEQIGENTAKCKICNTSKSFDFIINTDETITLSYEASKEFDFAIENTFFAKIINVSSSVISSGSYYKKVSSAKISPAFIGETKVNVIDSNGVCLTSSTLLIVEGEHQTQFAEVITPATCTDNGTGIYRCKFCDYEEQGVIYAPVHIEVVDAYTAPTCTKTGLIEGKHCSRCGEVLVAQETIPATGHTWENMTSDENENLHYECSVCHDTLTKINVKNVNIEIDKDAFKYHLTFPDIPVSYSGEELVLNEDYELIYSLGERTYQESHNTSTYIWSLGTCTITVRGINKYFGEISFDIEVGKFDMTKAHLMTTWTYEGNGSYCSSSYDMKSFEYDGTAKKQSGYRVCDDNDAISQEHFVITYKNNVHAGTATMIITGKGDYYTGTLEKDFTIYDNLQYDISSKFPDTVSNAWYSEAVAYVVGRGIMKGYAHNGRFGVADGIQRQDFLVMLANFDGVDLSQYENQHGNFSDVGAGAYYEAAVNWGKANNIVGGYMDGRFGVGDMITREQIVTFLYRYASHKGLSVLVTNSSKEITQGKYRDFYLVSDFAKDPIFWAVDRGVINGKESNTVIAPYGNAQRCEVAQIMYNIFKKNIF